MPPEDKKETVSLKSANAEVANDSNFDKAIANLTDVEKKYAEQPFKEGYNPHFYLHETIRPLKIRVERGERSKELQDALTALKYDVENTKVKAGRFAGQQASMPTMKDDGKNSIVGSTAKIDTSNR